MLPSRDDDFRGRPGDRVAANAAEPSYRLDIMTQDDVPEVSRVERRCFANPWPASAYRRELQNPVQNYYVVLRAMQADPPGGSDGTTVRVMVTRRKAKCRATGQFRGARCSLSDAVGSRTATDECRLRSSASPECGWPLTRRT